MHAGEGRPINERSDTNKQPEGSISGAGGFKDGIYESNTIGAKYDEGKLRWDLLPWHCVKEIVRVLTFGAKKYSDHGWKEVDNPKARYFAAMHRHLQAWWDDEALDPESGIHHLAHAGCCLLFLMFFTNLRPKRRLNENM